MFLLDDDAFNLAPDESARFYLLDKDGELVILIIEAFQTADLEAVLDAVTPIVESVAWE